MINNKMINNKITTLFSVLFFACILGGQAQSKPQISQYILNPYILNPAFAGIENYYDLKLSYRNQWVGIEGAPKTMYATFHAPIRKKDLKNSATTLYNNYETNNRNKQYWNDYKASRAHSGLGLQLFNDIIGPFNNLSIMATYAYHLGISPKINMALGLSAGVRVTSLNIDKLFFGNSASSDPAVFYTDKIDKYNMDMDAGILFYSAKYYLGISAISIIPQNLDFSNNFASATNAQTKPIYFISGGYRFPLNEDFNLLPSVRLKYSTPQPIQTDINAKLQYRDLFWIGMGYRTRYGVVGMVGINVLPNLTISYSYDYSTTQINTISSGSHEIVLGFAFKDSRNAKVCRNSAW